MLNCKDAAQLISEGLDHKLPLPKRLGLHIHLIMCKACNIYRQQLSDIKKMTSAYAKKVKKPSIRSLNLSSQVKQHIKKNFRKKIR